MSCPQNASTLDREYSTNSEKHLSGYFVQVPLELLSYDISPAALKLYMVLMKFARRAGVCWPGQERLADEMGLKQRRIRGLLNELEQAGLVQVENDIGKANRYYLKVQASTPAINNLEERQEIAGDGKLSSLPGGRQKMTAELHDKNKNINNKHINGASAPVCDSNSASEYSGNKPVTLKQVKPPHKTSPEAKAIETLLRENGVAPLVAPKLAAFTASNGRSVAEVQRLIVVTKTNMRVHNLPAYLTSLLKNDVFSQTPSVTTLTNAAPSNWSAGIDINKYKEGGKYAHLVANRGDF
jgi:DNA-binding MarR family transcriptional regulator